MVGRAELRDVSNREVVGVIARKGGRGAVEERSRRQEVVEEVAIAEWEEERVQEHMLELPRSQHEVITIDDEDETMEIDDFEEDAHDYATDILRYLKSVETSPPPPALTARVRTVLVDWLINIRDSWELNTTTLFLSVSLLDRFLGTPEGLATPKDSLQLAAVTAIMVACKLEESRPPRLDDFVWVTDNSYSAKAVRAMERRMVAALDWRLSPALESTFLEGYSRALALSTDQQALAMATLQASLLQASMVEVFPSLAAAAALYQHVASSSSSLHLLEEVAGWEAGVVAQVAARMGERKTT